MKKSVLRRLFDGEIYPSEKMCGKKPEYLRLSQEIQNARDGLCQTLSESQCEGVDKIEDLNQQLIELFSYEGFVSGYRLGVLMTIEVFNGKADTILNEEGMENEKHTT